MSGDEKWAIEFRNGSFFQTPEADYGGPLKTAKTFGSKQETEKYMNQHNWVYINGGMALNVTNR
jgi:hypothetical protein